MNTPFSNEPVLELRSAVERERLLYALAELDRKLPLEVPVMVEGKSDEERETLLSVDPGNPDRIVSRASVATQADVRDAVAASLASRGDWADRGVFERASIITRAAGILRSRRYELAALAVRECGKPWPEADADICEAIDFLEYYARNAIELQAAPRVLINVPGERNSMHYRPRGLVAVIAPWNFPFAIVTGMTAAALVTGNAVCLKPAEQSPGCALRVVEALHEAGVPAGALSLLPGEGDVGAALADNPAVQTIAFTGSSQVGLELMSKAAQVKPGQLHLKRVVAELGGKNCVIVDADADLDEVVPSVLSSAFGFGGQKCSAASRVLTHERIAERLKERLSGALDTLLVGQAETFGVDLGPLIESSSCERVERMVAAAGENGASVHRVERVPDEGYFAAPTLLIDPDPDDPVVTEEIFGPVLAIETVRHVDHALELISAQRHALTGGLFSRNPRTIAYVSERTPVGNLYVNREITGAMVGRQPFGGNRVSGTGSKAGGPDYLLHFVEPTVVTENTVRHGLTMDLSGPNMVAVG